MVAHLEVEQKGEQPYGRLSFLPKWLLAGVRTGEYR